MIDLEALITRPRRFVDVDVQHVIAQELARSERVVAALETAHADHADGRQQVTLKADRIAQRRRQAHGIDDGRANGFHAFSARRHIDMARARSVATLASGALR